jgi:membrane protease YdiL (CAAX protease family)
VLGGTRTAEGDPRVVDEVAAATRNARWAVHWRGWADWPLSPLTLAVAAVAVALDVTTAWTGISLGSLGGIQVSPALPLAALVVVWIGADRLGWSRRAGVAWRELAVGLGAVVALATVAYALQMDRPAQAVGLVLDALGEELVFRLAAVIVLGACCAWLLGRPWRNPRDWGSIPGFVALGAAAFIFSALPGHVAQMTSPATTLPFVSFGLVLGYTVLRTGAVWPAVLVHALVNFTTIAAWQGAGPSGLRLAVTAAVLLALVGAADLAGRRLGLRVRVPTLIDLHAGPDPELVGDRRLR